MADLEKVFDAFRNCITEPKCKDCPWEQCEQFNQKKVTIPVTLALDVLELLKEQKVDTSKYQYKHDHTDCIWYRDSRSKCPVTCSQYRDGWNDAMDFVFKNGAGYSPYKRR